MKFIYYLLTVYLSVMGIRATAQHPVCFFDFDHISSFHIADRVSGKSFPIVSASKAPEIVKGVKGNGLRTDGYSTWIEAAIPVSKKNAIGLRGWYALETFSTDTAAFFGLINRQTGDWLSAGFDTYGRPVIGSQVNGVTQYTTGDTLIRLYSWMQVVLNVSPGGAEMLVDGKRAVSVTNDFSNVIAADSLLIGKDIPGRMIGNFPLNALNGIIDEVALYDHAINQNDVNAERVKMRPSEQPSLAVPAIRFAGDFNRPKYHLIPAANWTNETHGLVFYKGRYHIFNQKDGNNLLLRKINWGHFSSPDLIHWSEHKPALRPSETYDREGIWSGHVIADTLGTPCIIYTGGSEDASICLATPADSNLISWNKYNNNPVIPHPPAEFHSNVFRDPFVFVENGTYYMIVGFGYLDGGIEKGAVLLYQSGDLKQWKYLHQLFTGNPMVDNSGVFWEMPVFVKMDSTYVLLVNKVPHKGEPADALYWTGDFINQKFIPHQTLPRHLEVVNRLLSPSLCRDEDGRLTAIAIVPDLVPMQQQYKQGWTHLYSMPRTWTLKDGKICQQPHPAVKNLRKDSVIIKPQIIDAEKPLLLVSGKHQYEIEMLVDAGNNDKFYIDLGKNASGTEYSRLCFDIRQNIITINAPGSFSQNIALQNRQGNYEFKNRIFQLRILVDGSMVEGFINDEDAFTTRMFPTDKNSKRAELVAGSDNLQLKSAKIWELQPAIVKQDF